MATNKSPIFLNSIVTLCASINTAFGTGSKTILTAGSDGGGVTNLSATTDDTSDVIAVLKMNDGSTTVVIGEVTVPAGAGTDGTTPAKDLFDAEAMPGILQADGSLLLGPSAILTVNAKVAVTAAKTLDITSTGGQYGA